MIRLGVLLLCGAVLSLGFAAVHAGEKETGFVNKIFKDKDKDIKYIVFVPKAYDGTKEFPVILFLHGAGESGTDGKKQAAVGLGKAIRNKKESFPFIVVFPQSQKGGWGANSAEGKRAIAILEQVEKDYKTDKKRVYLTGLSMGGFGTWSMAAAYPNRWAAIAPICGGGDVKSAAKIKDLPIWCFHGDADTAVKVERSREMIKAIKDAGGKPRYDEYPKVGHNSWDRAYGNAELYEWFLKHSTK
ncbi:MAG TPA: alpha/beta hydrolase-fold protein [Gemmataceae bacterium]|nr:alpha/beta hydrolase-fold protein [Gemmataceae bacterium]